MALCALGREVLLMSVAVRPLSPFCNFLLF